MIRKVGNIVIFRVLDMYAKWAPIFDGPSPRKKNFMEAVAGKKIHFQLSLRPPQISPPQIIKGPPSMYTFSKRKSHFVPYHIVILTLGRLMQYLSIPWNFNSEYFLRIYFNFFLFDRDPSRNHDQNTITKNPVEQVTRNGGLWLACLNNMAFSFKEWKIFLMNNATYHLPKLMASIPAAPFPGMFACVSSVTL